MAVMGKVGMTGAWGGAKVTIGRLTEMQVWDLVEEPLRNLLTVRDTSNLRFRPPWMYYMSTPGVPDYVWAPGEPSQSLVAAEKRAVRKLAVPDQPVFTLTYPTVHAPSNLDALLAELIKQEPDLEERRAEARKAEVELETDLEEAHGLFQLIVNRQADGSYGAKLMELVASGYATVEAPHRRVNSSWEKGAKFADQRLFGLSRKISGRIPDRFGTKLVVHTHNSYTGGVLFASIKNLIGEEDPGGNRPIEERYWQTFAHSDYDTWLKALKLPG